MIKVLALTLLLLNIIVCADEQVTSPGNGNPQGSYLDRCYCLKQQMPDGSTNFNCTCHRAQGEKVKYNDISLRCDQDNNLECYTCTVDSFGGLSCTK